MVRDPFSSSTGGAQLRAFVGRLALFTPLEYVPQAITGSKFGNGTKDGVRADVVFLDEAEGDALDPDEAEEMSGMLILNDPVVKELRPKIGSDRPMHLGRVKEIENRKGGLNAVVVLDPPSDADKDLARTYLAWVESQKKAPADPFAD
jgi:hypothetical protein